MGKYSELIFKLESLRKPDREIDLEVLNALAPHKSGDIWVWGAPHVPIAKHSFAVIQSTNEIEAELAERLDFNDMMNEFARKVPTVTATVDSIIKLAREVFPEAVFSINDYPETSITGVALNRYEYDIATGEGEAVNSAIAACIAALKAKEVADAE